MEKYFKRKSILEEISGVKETNTTNTHTQHFSKQGRVEVNLDLFPRDPRLCKKIAHYHPNDQNRVRKTYLGTFDPCQPCGHKFPQRQIENKLRRFVLTWFDKHADWLEYSTAKDVVFCLYCYLFKPNIGEQASGDCFVTEGYTNWKKNERFDSHVGGPNSAHNQSRKKCEDLLNQKQHIQVAYSKQSDQTRKDYRIHLTASLDCIQFLLRQGLAFRGRDESEDSLNQGNFFELLWFLANHNETINNVVLENAFENLKVIAHDIQKYLVCVAAIETTNAIINDLGVGLFAFFLDESHDVSIKEQVTVVLSYLDSKGCIIERFLGIVHVHDTTALSLKMTINVLFSKYSLNMSRLRGQGYDGASNMQGEFNGLKTLIMKENASAYYVHCFAHQFQLALVAMAKNNAQIALLFNLVANVVNIVGASCKRRDILREKQLSKVVKAL